MVCCRPEIADQVGEILVRHAKAPAEFYGFKVPLDAEYQDRPQLGRRADEWRRSESGASDRKHCRISPIRESARCCAVGLPGEPMPELIGEDKPLIETKAAATEARIEEITDPIIVASPAAAAAIAAMTATIPRGTSGIEQAFPRARNTGAPTTDATGPERCGRGKVVPATDTMPIMTLATIFPARGALLAARSSAMFTATSRASCTHRKIRTTTKKFWQETWKDGRWVKGAPEIKYLYGIRELLRAPPDAAGLDRGGREGQEHARQHSASSQSPTRAAPASGIVDFTPSRSSAGSRAGGRFICSRTTTRPGASTSRSSAAHCSHSSLTFAWWRSASWRRKSDVTDWLQAGAHQGRAAARARGGAELSAAGAAERECCRRDHDRGRLAVA